MTTIHTFTVLGDQSWEVLDIIREKKCHISFVVNHVGGRFKTHGLTDEDMIYLIIRYGAKLEYKVDREIIDEIRTGKQISNL